MHQLVNQSVARVNRNTFAAYITIKLYQYEAVHGLIEEFGGRVKQFTQDQHDHDDWHIFYEMAKLQRPEFNVEMREFFGDRSVA